MPEAPTHVCRKQGCEVATSGACAEGHSPLESCPWYGATEPASSVSSQEADEMAQDKEDFVILPSGEPLTAQDLDQFLCAKAIQLVAIVGEPDSGKTTLISSIYERFLKGAVSKWRFSGSKTLMGLEERSHESRMASGRNSPDTRRTSLVEGLRFFHLSVRSADEGYRNTTELMLSDRAGESYLSVRNRPTTGSELLEVARANIVAVLLDGRRLADPELRGNALHAVRSLLRALLDGGALGPVSLVEVVLTKRDLVDASPDVRDLRSQVTDFCDRLKRDFGKRVSELNYREIAARDPVGATESGIDALLDTWLSAREESVSRASISGSRITEFDRLLDRVGFEYLP